MFSTISMFVSSITRFFGSAATPPNPPTNLSAGSITISSVVISFTPPAVTTGIVGYIATTNAGSQAVSTASPITITGLASNTTYSVTIKAVSYVGQSVASSSINFTTANNPPVPGQAGLLYKVFNNYHSENVSYDTTATLRSGANTGYTNTISNINTGTNAYLNVNGQDNYSVFWYGYFLSDFTGTWTFRTNSDDGSYVWVGATATSGFTTANALVNNGGGHGMQIRTGTISLVSGTYYPIRIMFGEGGGGDDMQFSWDRNGVNTVYAGTGRFFYTLPQTGATSSQTNFGVPSQPVITSVTNITTNGAIVNFTQPLLVAAGSTYTLRSGSVTYGTASFPATVFNVTTLSPNTSYSFIMTAANTTAGTSLVSTVYSITTLPTPPVVQVINNTTTESNIKLITPGTASISGYSLLSIYPSGGTFSGSGSIYTISGLSANTPYLANFQVTNAAGSSTNILGLSYNTTPLITINTSSYLPAISDYGQYICVGSYGTGFGIYVSTNYGATFTKIITDSNAAQSAISATGQYMYVACNAVGKTFYSSNYGTSFTPVTVGANITSIACSSDGSIVYITDGTNSGIYYSTNYGITYSTIYSVTTGMNYIECNTSGTIAYFTSTTNGRGYSYNRILNTLTTYIPGGGNNASGIATSLDGLYVYISNFSGVCYRSVNGGYSFSLISTTFLPSSNYSYICCDTTGQYVYVHNATTALYYSSDYGVTFASTTMAGTISQLNMNRNSTYLGISSGSGIFLSTNSYAITTLPTPPTAITDISSNNNAITLSFTPPSGIAPIAGYKVTTAPPGGVGSGAPTSYTVYDLSANVSYSIFIQSINAGGYSALSTLKTSSTNSTVSTVTYIPAPSLITNPNFSTPAQSTNGSTYYVNSGFTASSGYNVAAISGWTIDFLNSSVAITNGSNAWYNATMPAGTTQAFSMVMNGTYAVQPCCILSQMVYLDTSGNYILKYSTIPRAVADPSYILLTSYVNSYSTANTLVRSTAAWNNVSMPFTITAPGTYAIIYEFLMAPDYVNTAINASLSLTGISIGILLNPPTNVVGTVISDTAVAVAFTPPPGTATSFTATSSPGGLTGTGASSPVTVSGLTGNTEYTFTVTATNSAGTSASSAASGSVTTNSVPNPPTNLALVGTTTSTSAVISFTPQIGTVVSYRGITNTGIVSYSTASPIVFSGLTLNTSYTVTIQSVNPTGTSVASSSFGFTTAATSGPSYGSTPTFISGMQLWVDAKDPNNTGVAPTNGSTISTWYDKSGGGRNATANNTISYNTSGLSAGYPALTFSAGTPRWLTGSLSITSNVLTVLIVGYFDSGSGGAFRWIGFSNGNGVNDYNNASFFGFLRQSNTGVGAYRNGQHTVVNPPAYSTPYLWETWFDGTNANNTVQFGNTTTTATNASNANFGISYYTIAANTNSGDAHYLTGAISEVFVFNRSLTTTERQQMEGYMSWKWGLQSKLPTTHPYYSSFPGFSSSTVLTAPTIGAASSITTTSALIGFTAPAGAGTGTTYDAAAGGTIYGSAVFSATSVFVSGLTSNTLYNFALRATNSNGTSPSSSTVAVTTLAAAPTNIVVTGGTTTTAVISFTPPTGAATITSYSVVTVPASSATTSGTPSVLTISGLSTNTVYAITLRAVNAGGTGTASTAFFVCTATASASSITSSSALLTFTQPGTATSETTYAVIAGGVTYGTAAFPATTMTASGLSSNTLYSFAVYATTSGVTVQASLAVSVTTLASAPTNVVVTGGSTTTAIISFTPPTGSATITSYTVTTTPSASVSVSGTPSAFTISGLTANTAYSIIIRAVNAGGSGDPSSTFYISTRTAVASSITSTSALITFTQPATAVAETTYAAIAGGVTYGTASYPATAITVSGLSAGTTYVFIVYATTSGLTIPASIGLSVTTTPNPPTSLAVSAFTDSTATVTFTPPSGTITSYTVTSSPGGLTATGASSPLTVTGLTGNTVYTFTATATSAAGTSASSVASAEITTNSVPSPPTNLAQVSVTATSVVISFTPPAGTITSYKATTNTGAVSYSTTSPMTISGLAGSISYTVTIQSINSNGTSVASGSVSVTTTATPTLATIAPQTFTSNTLSSGGTYTLTYSSIASATYDAYNAFIGSTTSYWQSSYSGLNSYTQNPYTSAGLYQGGSTTYATFTQIGTYTSVGGGRAIYADASNNIYDCAANGNTVNPRYMIYNPSNDTWGTPTVMNVSWTARQWTGIAYTIKAQRGIIIDQTSSLTYFYTGNPVAGFSALTQTLDTTVLSTLANGVGYYFNLGISLDGSKIVVCNTYRPSTVKYATWNGSNYTAWAATADTGTTYCAVDISPDGNTIYYSSTTAVYKATWTGTTYGVGTAIITQNLGAGNPYAIRINPDQNKLIFTFNNNNNLYYSFFTNGSWGTITAFGTALLGTTTSNCNCFAQNGDDAFYTSSYGPHNIYRNRNLIYKSTYVDSLTSVVSGEWLQLQLPTATLLSSYSLYNSNVSVAYPKQFYIVGSLDGRSWVSVDVESLSSQPAISSSYTVSGTPTYSYYRIIFNTLGGSAPTYISLNQVNLYSLTILSAPTIGSASSITNSSAVIGFTAPVGAAVGTTYDASANGIIYGSATFSATSVFVADLSSNTLYSFSVRATNGNGSSPYSSTVAVTTLPNPPTNVSVSSYTDSTAVVTFTAPTGSAIISSYTVTSSPGGLTGTGSASPITVTGLTGNTTYTFTATATNAAGTSASSVASGPITTNALPSPPTSLAEVSVTATSAVISFTPPAGTITSYKATTDIGIVSYSTGSPITISGLTASTAYTVTIQSINANGTSVASASVSITTNSGTTYSATPTVISGMQLWVDAKDPNNTGVQPADGTTISTWYDKSGGGRNATAKSGSPIAYNTSGLSSGYPALTFLASNPQWLTGSTSITSNVATVLIVGTVGSTSTTNARLISFSSGIGVNDYANNSHFGVLRQNNTGMAANRNTTYTTNNPPSYSTPYLFETWFDSTTANTTVQIGNSTTTTSLASTGNFNIAAYAIAANTNTGNTEYLSGSISEIFVFNRSLTTMERQQMEGYMSWKWGLQTNLPTAHPYYSSFPGFTSSILPAPTIGAASSITTTSALIGFTAPAGAAAGTTYDAAASSVIYGSAVFSATSVFVSGLTSNTLYSFAVRATNGNGTSVASSNVAVTTLAAAPTNIVVTGGTTTTSIINFTAPTGSATISSYSVVTTPSSSATTSGTASSLTISGLSANTAYTITLRAVNAGGSGTASAAFYVNTTSASASAITASSALITFVQPGSATASTTYAVIAGGVTFGTAAYPATTITAVGLSSNTLYPLIVYATTSGVTVPASIPLSVTTLASNPTNIVVTGGTTTTAIISFTPPTGTATITSYTVTTAPAASISVSGTSSAFTISGLTASNAYTMTIAAVNAGGTGTASAAFYVNTTTATASAVTASSALITFTQPASAVAGTTYAVIAGGVTYGTASYPATTITASGLSAGTVYAFQVYATTSELTVLASLAVSVTTVTGPPTSLAVSAFTDSTATVTFTPPSGTITSYRVTSSPGGLFATGSASPITVTGLTGNTVYTFTATATSAAGTSESSLASDSITTNSLPSPPTNLAQVSVTATSAVISFTPPAGSITSYKATTNTGVVSYSTASPITISGLASVTTYTVTIQSINANGTSLASGSVSITTGIISASLMAPQTFTSNTLSSGGTYTLTYSSIASATYDAYKAFIGSTTSYWQSAYSGLNSYTQNPYTAVGIYQGGSTTYNNYATIISSTNSNGRGIYIDVSNTFFFGNNIPYYSTYNVSTDTWNTPVLTNSSWLAGANFSGITYNPKVKRGVTINNNSGLTYFFTGSTSTGFSALTQTLDTGLNGTPGWGYWQIAMSPDGSRMVTANYWGNSYIYLSTWNGTNYTAWAKTLDNSTGYLAPDMSLDGSFIIYAKYASPYKVLRADWNGTTYGVGTQIIDATNVGSDAFGVKINPAGDKIIYMKSTGSGSQIWLSTYNGTSWSSFTAFSNTVVNNASNIATGLSFSRSGDDSFFYTIYGTNTVHRVINPYNKGAFDNSANLIYRGEYLQLQIPTGIPLSYYSLYNSNVSVAYPKAFYVVGSLDGISWVTVDSKSLSVQPSTLSTYSVSSATSYTYYRVIFNTLGGSAPTYISLNQLNMYGLSMLSAPTIGAASSITTTTAIIGFTAPAGAASGTTYDAAASSVIYGSAVFSATSVFVSGLTSNTLYNFAVRATNGNGTSPSSSTVAVTTLAAAPTNIVVTGGTTTTAIISFTPPTGTATITSYSVVTTPSSSATTSGTASALTISGLSTNTSYTITLRAVNAGGTGTASAAFYVSTATATASAVTASSALITFTQPASAVAGTTYAVIAGGTTYGTASYPATTITASGLSAGTVYAFQVYATTSELTVPASLAVSVATVTGPPTSLAVSAFTDSTATVTFTPPSGTITSYRVTSSPGGLFATGSASPITVTGLTGNTTYTFTATATSAAGTSESSVASDPITTNSVPSPPTNLAQVSVTGTSAVISFTPPVGTVVSYKATTDTGIVSYSTGSPITISGLTASTSYTVTIQSINANGTSVASGSVNVTTSAAVASVVAPTITNNQFTTGYTINLNNDTTPPASTTTINSWTLSSIPGTSPNGYNIRLEYGTTSVCPSTTAAFTGYGVWIQQSSGANTTTLTQSLNFTTTGDFTISAYIAPRPTFYNTTQSLSILVDSTVVVGPITRTANSAFELYSGTYSALTTGTKSLIMRWTQTATNDSALIIGNITITTLSFDPKTISGNLLWLDSNDSTSFTYSSGAVISQWNDKSGLGYHFAQSAVTYQPSRTTVSNGKPGVSFINSKVLRSLTFPMPTNYSVFLVGYTGTQSTNARAITVENNPVFTLGTVNGNTNFATFVGNNVGWNDFTSNSPTASVSSLCIMEVTNNNTNGGLLPYVNGTVQNAKDGRTVARTDMLLGAYTTATYPTNAIDQGWNGYICEVLIYNSVLSATDRQKVEGYLAWKWSTNTSLPVAHPYYSGRPESGPTILPAPTIGAASSITTSSAIVGFTAPAGAASGTTYDAAAGGTIYGSAVFSATSVFISGLTSNTLYSFAVRATNGNGTSPSSSTVAVTTLAAAPTNIVVTGGTTTTAIISFTPPTGSATISSYSVVTTPTSSATTSGTASALTISGLTANTAYTITLRAVNAGGTGTASAAFYVSTATATASAVTASSALITFTQPASAVAGTTYAVIAGGTTYGTASYPATTITASGLSAGTTYSFIVYATTSELTVLASLAVSVATLPAPPTSLTVSAYTDSTATVTFTPPSGTITSYRVTSSPGGLFATGSASPITVTGLTGNTVYTFTATATSAAGTSVSSVASDPITTNSLPSPPTNLAQVSVTPSSAVISFTPPASVVTSYKATTNTGVVSYSTASPITISGLASVTTYTVTIQSINANGTSVASTSVSITTSAVVATFSPTSISGNLLWLDSSDATTFTYSSGAVVSQWNDKSGLGYHYSQATVAHQPSRGTISNGNPGVLFPAASTTTFLRSSTFPMPTSYSVFVIGYSSVNGYGRALSMESVFYLGIGDGNTNFATFVGNNSTWNGGDVTTNTPAVSVSSLSMMEVTNNNTTTGLIPYVNGTAQNARNGSTVARTDMLLGAFNTTLQGWKGYICEVLIYNSVLSTTDRQKVEGYLAWKWGTNASLPVGHTYYSAALYSSPSAPTIGAASSITTSSAIINYTAPVGAAAGMTYDAAASSVIYGSAVFSATSVFISGLTSNTLYNFAVRATNSGGTSPSSSTVAVTTLATAPTNIVVTGGTTTTAIISFTPPTGTATITSYSVVTTPSSSATTSGTASALTISGLSTNTSYTITLRAVNAGGTGTASAAFYVSTATATASAVTASSALITFTQPASAVAGTTYAVIAGGTTYGTASYPATTITASGLSAGTTYSFIVYATTSELTVPASLAVSVATLPAPPTSLTVSAYTDSTATVTFTPPSGTITSYRVTSSPGGLFATGSASPITVTGLTGNTTYTFTATATSAAGTSESSLASAEITTNSVPSPPTSLAQVSVTGSSAVISFTPPAGSITSYKATTNTGVVSYSTGSPITISGLTASTSYTVTIQSINANGTSVASGPVSVTTSSSSVVTSLSVSPTVHFDANLNVTSASSLVSSWGDVSNSYFVTQSTNSLKPTITSNYMNSLFGIVFPGTSGSVLSGNTPFSTTTTSATMFFVMKITSMNGLNSLNNYLSSNGTWSAGSIHLCFNSSNFQISINSTSNDFATGVAQVYNTPFILMVNISSASGSCKSYLRRNGTSSSVFTHKTSSVNLLLSTIDVFGWSGDASRSVKGGITQLIMFNRDLTTQEIESVESYLSYRWAITLASGPTILPAPTIGAASSITTTSAVIGFTAPAGAASGTTYDAAAGGTIYGSAVFSATSVFVSGLTSNTLYNFAVRATNGNGTSPSSSTVAVTTLAAAPTNIVVTGGTNFTAIISFTPPTGPATISSYTVTTVPSASTSTSGTASALTISSLTSNIAYTMTIAAVNAGGTGAASTFYVNTTSATASSITTTSALITFTQPPSATGSTTYTVIAGGVTYGTASYPATTITASGLSAGTTYSFVVYATTSGLTVPASIAVSITTSQTPPTTATVVSKTSTSVTISFTGSSSSTYLATTVPPDGTGNGSGTPSSYTIYGLFPGTTYSITLVATSAAGKSEPSSPLSVTTALGPPTILSASSITTTSAVLNITPPSGAVDGTTYTAITGGITYGTASYPSTSISVTGLSSNTLYQFTATATNTDGTSSPSNAFSLTTLAEAPRNISINGGSATSTVISFTPPTGSATITSYTVTTSPSASVSTSGTSSSYTISGLTAGSFYTITIAAVNAAGVSTTTTFYVSTRTATASSITASSALITFTQPATAAGSTTYEVIAGGVTYGTESYPATSITASGLSSNTVYGLVVYATTDGLTIPASLAVSVTTAPGPPSSLIGTATGSSRVSVAFTPPSGTGTITSYTVTSSPGGIIGTGSSSPIVVTGLTANTAYTFTATATNASGTSGSSTASAEVTTNSLPNPPSNLVASTISGTSASVAFTLSTDTVTGYTVTSSPSGFTGTGSSSPITVSGLSSSGTYTFTAVATNANGNSTSTSPSNSLVMNPIPQTGLVLELLFGANTPPTSSNGVTITSTGPPIMTPMLYNSVDNGYVLNCTNGTSNLQTNLTTPSSFSRCFWIYINSLSTITKANTLSSSNVPIWYRDGSKISVGYNGGANAGVTDTVDRGSNVWVNYVATYDNATTTMKLYVNGSVVATNTAIPFSGDGAALYINGGQYARSTAYYDNIRCYNRALSADEVSSLYNAEQATVIGSVFNVVSTTNLILHLPLENNYTNLSSVSSTITQGTGGGGSTTFTTASAVGTHAINYTANTDAGGNRIYIANMAASVASGLSISLWIKVDKLVNGANDNIYFEVEGLDANGYGLILMRQGGASKNNLQFTNGTTFALNNMGDATGAGSPAWYHLVFVVPFAGRTAASQCTIYVNNVLKYNGNYATNVGSYPTTTTSLTKASFGSSLSSPHKSLIGSMDDIRIYNKLLSASEVNLLFNLKNSVTLGT